MVGLFIHMHYTDQLYHESKYLVDFDDLDSVLRVFITNRNIGHKPRFLCFAHDIPQVMVMTNTRQVPNRINNIYRDI